MRKLTQYHLLKYWVYSLCDLRNNNQLLSERVVKSHLLLQTMILNQMRK